MDAQLQFGLPDPRQGATEAQVAQVEAFLAGRDWTPSGKILAYLGIVQTEESKRWLRRVRGLSAGRILGGPGMPGYKLTSQCTVEEFNHWRATMRSQAREMIRAIVQADKVFYRRLAA
jgi:hypothetical protein